MLNKHIVEAQKVLKRLDGTPVKFLGGDGKQHWQVTYDDDTYNSLIGVLEAVAHTPMKEYVESAPVIELPEYHRNKI